MNRSDWILDEKARIKAGYYKRRILVLQENFKIIAVTDSVLAAVMLCVNIVNACVGGISVPIIIVLNVIWILLMLSAAAYVLIGISTEKKCFEKIRREVYDPRGTEYRRLAVLSDCEPLKRGERIRMYESEKYYMILCDGLDEFSGKFWTKYNFRRDFGILYCSKDSFVKTEGNAVNLAGCGKTISLGEEIQK